MSKKVDYYILYEEAKPISKGCIFRHENFYRIENISTVPEHRNKGAATYLVNSMIKERFTAGSVFFLFVEPGTTAERVYAEAGFETIFTGLFKIYTKEI